MQLQQHGGRTLNWLNSLGKGWHCRGGGGHTTVSPGAQAGSPRRGCPGLSLVAQGRHLMLYTPKLERKKTIISALSQVGSVGVKSVTYLHWSSRTVTPEPLLPIPWFSFGSVALPLTDGSNLCLHQLTPARASKGERDPRVPPTLWPKRCWWVGGRERGVCPEHSGLERDAEGL